MGEVLKRGVEIELKYAYGVLLSSVLSLEAERMITCPVDSNFGQLFLLGGDFLFLSFVCLFVLVGGGFVSLFVFNLEIISQIREIDSRKAFIAFYIFGSRGTASIFS